MSPNDLLLWLLTGGAAMSGWIIKTLAGRIADLEHNHAAFQIEVAKGYVTHEAMRTFEERLMARLDRLEAKIEGVKQQRRAAD